MGRATAIVLAHPLGRGQQVIFQRFLYQILCVFSQMKETKRIRQDFYPVAWVMP